ncbi:AI-2E family transporter [Ciceribacter ferrooxidans]|uniref:AI-2E family transporter n=1 Tax=Ciceribacter ferrooxidans TaxID=2509717 RepID=A0A4Q2T0F0_9HYPH|nr:AI-2E family transporter [Ciceribacter ferrooxidans]RYC12035.1 AI-2E family transporter [Ciceribacter ferrooxidans]
MNDRPDIRHPPTAVPATAPQPPRRKGRGRAPRRTALDLAQSWAVIGIFAIVATGGIYVAAAVLMPVTLAVVVGLILGAAADRLGKLGIPPMLAGLILATVVVTTLFLGANALVQPLGHFAEEAPRLIEAAVERVLPYLERIEWLHISEASLRGGPVSAEALLQNTGAILTTIAAGVTPALLQGLIFFVALALFLGSRHSLRRGLIIAFRDRSRRLSAIRVLNAIESSLGSYFAAATLLYSIVGVAMTVIAFVGGLQMPLLWGLLAFISSYVPFLGITVTTFSVAVGGLVTHDSVLVGLAPAMVFFVVHGLVENLLTPAVMGRRLEINPFVVFVAIVFWTWMWGAVGAVLALPLSLIGMAILDELLPERTVHPKLPG